MEGNQFTQEDTQTAPQSAASAGRRKKGGIWGWLLVVVILAALIGGVWWYLSDGNLGNVGLSNAAAVATVNGEQITEEELAVRLNQSTAQLQAQGVDLNDETTRNQARTQLLQDLINEELVLQDAAEREVTVTTAEVTTAFDEIKARFESEQAFQTELTSNNMTEAELRENVERQLILDKYLSEVGGVDSVAVTDAEVAAAYAEYEQTVEDPQPLEEIAAQIEQFVQQQKVAALVEQIVESLRADASVEVLI